MILFLDTSALVKLYVLESGSRALHERIKHSLLAVSPLTYGEMHATFARRMRDGLLTPDEHMRLCEEFEANWTSLLQIPFSTRVLALVPGLCQRHPLRGADAMQLACALMLRQEDVQAVFTCSDRQLLTAARAEEVETFDPAGSWEA